MRYSQQECLSFMTMSTREVDVAMPDEGQMPVGCDEFIGKQWSWPLPITHWTHSWGLGAWNGWQQDCPILAFFSCGFHKHARGPLSPSLDSEYISHSFFANQFNMLKPSGLLTESQIQSAIRLSNTSGPGWSDSYVIYGTRT